MADIENSNTQAEENSPSISTQDNNSDLVELRETVMSLSYNDYIAVLQSFDTSALSSQNIEDRKRAAFYLELLVARGSVFVFENNENPEQLARNILSHIPVEEPAFAIFFANIAAMREHIMAIENAHKHLFALEEDGRMVREKAERAQKDYDAYMADGGNKRGGLFSLFLSKDDEDTVGELLDLVNYYKDRVERSKQLIAQTVSDIKELQSTLERLTSMDKEFSKQLTDFFSRFDA